MEYIYTALLLHSAGKKINEENVKKVLTASGAKVDDAKIKALISALEGVKIEEVMKQSAVPVAVAAPEKKEEKVEEKKKEKPEDVEKKGNQDEHVLNGMKPDKTAQKNPDNRHLRFCEGIGKAEETEDGQREKRQDHFRVEEIPPLRDRRAHFCRPRPRRR